jgi:outer membrane lipopolysaccharide assembly protein LptE/RlpB
MKLGLLGLLLVAGCGYSAGQVAGGDGRSISVPMFVNTTFRRDLERDLTRFVREEIRNRSGYRVSGENPDLVLTGKIVSISEDVLSERTRGQIRESSVLVEVEITVVDARTGKTVVPTRTIAERQSFVPVKNESIRTAEIEAMRSISERIVYSLDSDW